MGKDNPNSFRGKVFNAVRQIPKGETRTYKEVAKLAGNPNAARAVGSILHTNHNPDIPCHRVIQSDGALGGYNRGERKKQQLLMQEGAVRKKGSKVLQ